jgi:hypothetical protein
VIVFTIFNGPVHEVAVKYPFETLRLTLLQFAVNVLFRIYPLSPTLRASVTYRKST